MPTRWKINEVESKAVLREVARRLDVSSVVVDEKTKKGLFVPWGKWHSGVNGERGTWDRSSFATLVKTTWRQVFSL
jgi:hypothetical protein